MYIILTENDQLTMLYVLTRFLHVGYDSMDKYLLYYVVLISVTVVYNAGQQILYFAKLYVYVIII